ncbi:MAG: lamin tail domain-containing protein [Tepidisphaerales bacterium]
MLHRRIMRWRGARVPERGQVIDALEPRLLLAANVVISEILANNVSGIVDEDGAHSDWIELRNLDSTAVNLQGWSLSDNAANPAKWVFPAVNVPGGGYLVVFASGKNRTSGPNLHTNFALNSAGEYLGLFRNDLSSAYQFSPHYPSQEADISYGLDGSALRYFATPTPGAANQRAEVVINEIHYQPDIKNQLVEYIELFNPGSAAVDLSGATFSKGVTYTFPAGASLGPGAYLVITENTAAFTAKFNVTPYAQWTPDSPPGNDLANGGDDIRLLNKSGGILDDVSYGAGFPWPTVGDSPGYSIQLINPDFDNNLGGNWRSAAPSVQRATGADVTLINRSLPGPRQNWDYRKGTSEPATDASARNWKQNGYIEDATWFANKPAPIGYDPTVSMGTTLSDMNNGYASVYMRKTFTVTDPSQFSSLRMNALYDDGFNIWINGVHVLRSPEMSVDDPPYDAVTGSAARENNNYITFQLGDPRSYLVAGTNVIAVHFHNVLLSGSSDGFFDCDLIATPVGPAAGAQNSVFAANAPPQIRQVDNSPMQPGTNVAVTVTAKVTDPQGVASVNLQYQLVDPGNYINLSDAAYVTNWTTVPMHDDGLAGDAVAGDSIYTAVLPAGLQTSRRLVRYRIQSTDAAGAGVQVPYTDDPQPNFAYFVYDANPAYTAAVQPGVTTPVTVSAAVMNSIPSLYLISKQTDVENSTWYQQDVGNSAYNWHGTIVFNGEVYDHIGYRPRGGVWRYAMGKNAWKFDFNNNHEIQMVDDYGNPWLARHNKLNLRPLIQQRDYWHRGEQGLFESVSLKMFQLMGVPASDTTFVQLRVIDKANAGGTSQYTTDFWGLYLAIENYDGDSLKQHGLPDGNQYDMDAGYGNGGGSLNNIGPTQLSDNSDLLAYTNYYKNNTPTDQWWADNLDLTEYYNYRAVVEGVHHYDIDQAAGKNYVYYHNPVTGKWDVLPWDLDLTWSDNMYGGGDDPYKSRVLPAALHPTYNRAYQNRMREFIDLLYNSDQTGALIDEMAAKVYAAGGASMIDADRMQWDYNPIMVSSHVNSSKAGQGWYYQGSKSSAVVIPAPGGYVGMMNKMKAYILSRASWIYSNILTDDSSVPYKPTAYYIGSANFPVNNLRFRASGYGSPGGRPFAAMQWRIGEYTDPNAPGYDPKAAKKYEINAAWDSGEITTFNSDIQIPPGAVVPGHSYRVRVRFKDDDGRWSHWSDVGSGVTQFAATASTSAVTTSLRVTELNYHPSQTGDEEFIELKNIGAAAINLAGVQFTKGILFTFPSLDLSPGEACVVVKDLASFQAVHSTINLKIAGAYGPNEALSNAGEELILKDSTGVIIQDFVYDDAWYPITDGNGATLVINNPAQPLSTWSSASAWHASTYTDGTPGADENTTPAGAIVVNEVLSHTDASPTGDWVEFYNTTASPLDISGWFLSDSSSQPQKYRIPSGTVIAAYGYVVFNQLTQFDVTGGPGVLTPFSYSDLGGDKVVLSSANSFGVLSGWRVKQTVDAAPKEVTTGRVPLSIGGYDFTFLSMATKAAANAAPLIGPVVINELLYNPATGGPPEYVELHNISSVPVQLYDPLNPTHVWKFTNGITFDFPQDTILQPDEYVLVVPSDPAAFLATHPEVPASTRVFGPFTGNLNDNGETIALGQPGDTELDGTYAYYTVDSVKYGIAAPWPVVSGVPIAKTSTSAYSNDPANWKAEVTAFGSPGRPNLSLLTGDATSHIWTLKRNGANFEIYNGYPAADSPLYTTAIASTPPFTVLGNSADDQLYLDTGAGLPIPAAGLAFDGGAGADTLNILGGSIATLTPGSASGSGSFAFADGSTLAYISAEAVNLSDVGAVTLKLPNAGNTLSVSPAGGALQIGGTSGAAPVGPIKVTGLGTLTAQAPAGSNSLSISGGAFAISLPDGFNLGLSGSADISLAGYHRFSRLSLAGSAALDVQNNDIVVDYSGASPLEQIRQWIFNGIQGSASARLLTSRTEPVPGRYTTLAAVDNQMIRQTTWDGRPLTTAPNFSQVIVKYTYRGDTNLDGVVNNLDYYNVVAGMGRSGTWLTGDVDNDGIVSANDLAEVSLNLGAGSGAGGGPVLFAAAAAAPAAAAPVKRLPAKRPKVVAPARPKRPAPRPKTPHH